jgi:hypothetical protein
MTIQILKPTIEAGKPAFLTSIDGELPEPYTEKGLAESLQSEQSDSKTAPSVARDITQFVNYADC